MTTFKRLFSICALLALAACGGGGGDPGTPAFGPGAGTGPGGGTGGSGGVVVPTAADLVLVLSSSTISNSGLESVSATATALDANRNALAAVPVAISVNNDGIVTPSGTVTDATGRLTATVGIGANTSLRTVTVTVTSGALVRTAALLVQAGTGAAGQASLALGISSNTVTASTPATVTATLRNAQNEPIVGQVILLSSVRGLSTLNASTALTDASGTATVTVRPSANGLSGADEIQATTSVRASSGANIALNASVGFNVTGATASAADLVLVLSSSTISSNGLESVTATATTLDVNRNAIAAVPVVISVNNDGIATPSGTVTDTAGRLTATVGIGASTSLRTITVTATSGTLTRTAALQVQSGTGAAGQASLALGISSNMVTATTPATVTATLRNAQNEPIVGQVVQLSSMRGLSTLNASTALTDANGRATVTVRPAVGGVSGADEIQATTSVRASSGANVALNASVGFNVTGATVAAADLVLALSSSTISNSGLESVTATAIALDANRNSVGAVPVVISVNSGGVVTSNGTVTDIAGRLTAAIGIGASTNLRTITVTATSGALMRTATLQVQSGTGAVGQSSLALAISSNTVTASTPATVTATLRNAQNEPIVGQVVQLSSVRGLSTLNASTALTDANGRATVTVRPAVGGVSGADEIQATTSVRASSGANVALNASVGFNVTGATVAAADLVLALSSSTISNSGLESVTATAIALDANRNSVGAVPVVISVNSGGVVTSNGTVTDIAGRLTAAIGIGASTNLRTITVTATSGALTRTATLQVQSGTGAVGQTSLALAISSNTVTASTPATVTATLRNAQNLPISGQVILLSSVRGLSAINASTALTDVNGTATVTVRPAAGGLSGADEIQATTSVATNSGANTALNASIGFNVTGATATISVALSPTNTTLRASTSPVDFVATVRDQGGNPVANHVVAFSAVNNLASVNPASAITDFNGRASARVAPVSAATNAAETLRASTTIAGRDLLGTLSVQLVAEVPSIAFTLSNSNVSTTAPVTGRATVLSAAGVPIVGTVVTFASASNLAAFNPGSAATDANGVATTAISPRLATSAGADLLRASATVTGITRTAEIAAQFTGTTSGGVPTLTLEPIVPDSISAASPATVTARLREASGVGVAGQVVSFTVVRGLASTNVATALTDGSGRAVVVLSPINANTAGADEITASASYAGSALSSTRGFQVQATAVTLDSLTAAANPLSAYGQTTLTLGVTGASVASPVNITLISACVSQGKATLSPATLSVTAASTNVQYRDNGCGAVLGGQPDLIQAVVTATGASRSLALNVQAPAESSIAFVTASPEQIFLRGSGFTESSVVTFEVRDAAGNPLPGRTVELRLQTGAGGVTMEGRGVQSVSPPSANPFTQVSNASGRIAVRVNSGTLPTPVRISARLRDNTAIATVSSNLSVAVGLPSQLNFSLSQTTRNIEGYNIDGTANAYQIIAADRSGNPVPAGTSINFISEGGQIEAIKQTQLVNGISRTTANFVSAEPRPVDGRVTVTVYALGEESFLDLSGNNIYDSGEPFQDLGNIFQDRNYNGSFQATQEEFIPLAVNNNQACAAISNNLLLLNVSIPSAPGTCSGTWSGAGQVYVRRAAETVLSTSAARPVWLSTAGLSSTCSARAIDMQTGPETTNTARFVAIGGDVWYGASGGFSLPIIVADANPGSAIQGLLPRLNPMAAGTTITASTPTTGLTVLVGGGTPVGSTTEATGTSVAFSFTDPFITTGVVFVTFTSPSGLSTTVTVPVTSTARPTVCSP